MVQPYYAQPNIFQRLLVQQGWGRLLVGGVLGGAILGYLFLSRASTPRHLASDAYTQEMAPVDLLSKAEEPKTVPDPRIAELLLRQKQFEEEMQQLREAELRQQRILEDLLNRKPPPDKEPPKTPTKPKIHRQMGYMAFQQPEEKVEEAKRYTLAAGTKISCLEETQVNSNVENGALAMVNEHIWDTRTRQNLLIPHGSRIDQKYKSANLIPGNERVPMYSTVLILPDGREVDLEEETHTLDQVGQAGLATWVDTHFWRAVPYVLLQGVMRGTQQVVSGTNPFASGVANSTAQYGVRITQPYLDVRPTIHVDASEPCVLITQRAIQLPAYVEKRS